MVGVRGEDNRRTDDGGGTADRTADASADDGVGWKSADVTRRASIDHPPTRPPDVRSSSNAAHDRGGGMKYMCRASTRSAGSSAVAINYCFKSPSAVSCVCGSGPHARAHTGHPPARSTHALCARCAHFCSVTSATSSPSAPPSPPLLSSGSSAVKQTTQIASASTASSSAALPASALHQRLWRRQSAAWHSAPQ
jgi:hypothetical protein